MTNRLLNKLKSIVFCGNYKRTQQEVLNVLLPYLYNRYMVCAINKYAYPNIHVLSMSLLYYFYKVNIFPDIIILDFSTTFQTYNLISCDISCDHGYIPLHCSRELK